MPDETTPDTGNETETPDTGRDTQTEPDHKAEAEKWKALARKHEAQSKANAEAVKKLKEYEDRDKSDTDRANDRAADAERRATTAEKAALRLDVALEKAPDGMSIAQVRKLAKRLSGDTREELEADAAELFAEFAPNGEKPDARRRPQERLRSGTTSTSDAEETNPEKLAAKVPRMY